MKGKSGKLNVTCFSVRFPARLSGDALPTRKLVLPWGVSQAIDGAITLDDSTVHIFSATQKARGWDRVALDFEHNTLEGTKANKESKEPREVAAFGVPTLVPGEGLYLEALEWTPAGLKAVPNFCDLSPALAFRPGSRTVAGLHSVALTRAGAIEGIRAFSVELAEVNPITGDHPMERTVLLALLNLADSATDADILAAAKALGATLKGACDISAMSAEVKGIKETIVPFSATVESHKTSIEGLAVRVQAAEDKIVGFSADRAKQEREAVIDQARREGKVLPFSAEELQTVAIDTLRSVARNTPVTVPMEQRTQNVEPFSVEGRVSDPGTISKVAAMFNRKPEDLQKAGV
jgi:phage I-like protein